MMEATARDLPVHSPPRLEIMGTPARGAHNQIPGEIQKLWQRSTGPVPNTRDSGTSDTNCRYPNTNDGVWASKPPSILPKLETIGTPASTPFSSFREVTAAPPVWLLQLLLNIGQWDPQSTDPPSLYQQYRQGETQKVTLLVLPPNEIKMTYIKRLPHPHP